MPHDLPPPVFQAFVFARGGDILEGLPPDEGREENAFILPGDFPSPDQTIQKGVDLHHDPFNVVFCFVVTDTGMSRLEGVRSVPFERDEFFIGNQGKQFPDAVSQLPDDPAGYLVRGDVAFLDDLNEEKTEILDKVLPVDTGMSPTGIGVDARQRRGEKDNEERSDVAAPTVVPVTGDEFEKDGVFPVQICRLVMKESDQIDMVGKGKQGRAFRPYTFICFDKSLGRKLFPVTGKRKTHASNTAWAS